MLFDNPTIDIQHLPPLAEISWNAPAPGHLRQGLVQTAILFGVFGVGIAIAQFIGVPTEVFYPVMGVYILLLTFSIIFVIKDHQVRGYALRQRDITAKSGWIFRNVTTVPFNRIQHVETKEGVIERLFGLSTLQVFTAGGSASDLAVPGLPADTAIRIKEFISVAASEQPVDQEEE